MQRINYVCFGNASGYSQAAQDMILAIHRSGKYDVRVQYIFENTVRRQGTTSERTRLFKSLQEKQFNKDCYQIFHCIPSVQNNFKKQPANKTIGFATFETFNPPNDGKAGWIHKLNKNDGVICPSRFNEKIFRHAGVSKPIFYIPHGCDTDLYNKDVEPLEKHDRFTFLFFSEWRLRKGYKVLLEAWARAFRPTDNVQLIIKTSNNKAAKASSCVKHIVKEIGFAQDGIAPVRFEKRIFDEEQLPRFIKSADCLVSPTRGEGFGLPGLQCMFLKVPVIITNFSGCQDYANKETATLLEPSGFELITGGLDALPQFRDKKWPIVTVADTIKAMRGVFENYDNAKKKADSAYDFVMDRFTYDHVFAHFDNMMHQKI